MCVLSCCAGGGGGECECGERAPRTLDAIRGVCCETRDASYVVRVKNWEVRVGRSGKFVCGRRGLEVSGLLERRFSQCRVLCFTRALRKSVTYPPSASRTARLVLRGPRVPAHLQALPVDRQHHQESLWRENLESGGNPRTTTPTGYEPNNHATVSRIEDYSGDPYNYTMCRKNFENKCTELRSPKR